MSWWVWAAFGGAVMLMLLVDARFFGRSQGVVPFRQAAIWSVGWAVLGVAFGGLLWLVQSRQSAEEYLAGFVIEKSLSIDNLFVFALVLSYFAVPPAFQRRVIFWGITGAVVLRAVFILTGAALLEAAHFTLYVFGGFLVLTGIRMAFHREADIHPEKNPLLRLMRKLVPLSSDFEGDRFLVRRAGALVATPMLAALVLVATFDVVFAVDSIPAIFAVTRDTFIVFAANAFSLLGLSALYFLLVGMVGRFRFLNVGLALVLVFVGAKMLVSDVYKFPVHLSLVVIVTAIAGAVFASLLSGRGPDGRQASVPSIRRARRLSGRAGAR